LNHYQHFEVAADETGGEHVFDTIEFLPTKYNMPKTSSEDRITAALEEISSAISAIKHPQLRTPFLNGDATNNIIQELTETFQTETAPPRVAVKTTIATPYGSPRVPNKQHPSESNAPRLPQKKSLFPTNWDRSSTNNSKTEIIKAKLSNMMPAKNYTNSSIRSSMRMGMQKSCPIKK